MASSTANPPAPNLAAVLSIKRKIAEKNAAQSNGRQTPPPPPPVANAHSNERITYHQDTIAQNPPQTIPTTVPENTTEQPKISRKTKQLEVGLLDKKMEEINRKQEEKTNEALGTWKGFDSVNYGFNSTPGASNTTPVPPVATKERTATPAPKQQPSPVQQPSPDRQPSRTKESLPVKHHSAVKQHSPAEQSAPVKQQPPVKQYPPAEQSTPVKPQSSRKQPSPERVDPSVKDQPKSKLPLQEEETSPPQKIVQKEPSASPSPKEEPADKRRSFSTPSPPSHEEKPIERQSSTPPPPFPQHSRVKSPEQERSRSVPHKSPTPVIENTVPISSIISDPQTSQKNTQPYEKPSLPTSDSHHFKLFPDIKHYEIRKPRHALKSIQRSMDRYRFHVW